MIERISKKLRFASIFSESSRASRQLSRINVWGLVEEKSVLHMECAYYGNGTHPWIAEALNSAILDCIQRERVLPL